MCSGLFITIHDLGNVINVLSNWPVRDIRVLLIGLFEWVSLYHNMLDGNTGHLRH